MFTISPQEIASLSEQKQCVSALNNFYRVHFPTKPSPQYVHTEEPQHPLSSSRFQTCVLTLDTTADPFNPYVTHFKQDFSARAENKPLSQELCALQAGQWLIKCLTGQMPFVQPLDRMSSYRNARFDGTRQAQAPLALVQIPAPVVVSATPPPPPPPQETITEKELAHAKLMIRAQLHEIAVLQTRIRKLETALAQANPNALQDLAFDGMSEALNGSA